MNKIQQRERVAAMRDYLAAIGHPISSNQGYELLARSLLLKSRHVLAAIKDEDGGQMPRSIRLGGVEVPILAPNAPPLSVQQMRALNWEIDHIVAAAYTPGQGGDLDAFNDEMSLKLTGNECALEDIAYQTVPASAVAYPAGFVAVRVTGYVSSPEDFFADEKTSSEQAHYRGLEALYDEIVNNALCTLTVSRENQTLSGCLSRVDVALMAKLREYANTQGVNNEDINTVKDLTAAVFTDGSREVPLKVEDLKYAEASSENYWSLSSRELGSMLLHFD